MLLRGENGGSTRYRSRSRVNGWKRGERIGKRTLLIGIDLCISFVVLSISLLDITMLLIRKLFTTAKLFSLHPIRYLRRKDEAAKASGVRNHSVYVAGSMLETY